MSTKTDELTEARKALTPDVVAHLRALADAATKMADHLTEVPGDGLGLAYAPLWIAWDKASTKVMAYQNHPLEV